VDRCADEGRQLLFGLVGVGEEPVQQLQHQFVGDRGEPGHLKGDRVGDDRLRGGDAERLAGVAGQDGAGGLERGGPLPQGVVAPPQGPGPALGRGAPPTRAPPSLLRGIPPPPPPRGADARRVRGISGGQPSRSGVAWARGGPTNTARSPQLAVRPRSPSAMPRYKCPIVANSWPRGSASARCTGSRAGATETKPCASCRSMPSGRSRNRKCRSARAPHGSRSSRTAAGKYPDRCGKLGRPNTGAAPIAVIRFDTSARCSISSTAISRSVLRHRRIVSACPAVKSSALPLLRLNSAYRY